MANKIKGWLVDVNKCTSEVVEFEDSLENLYKLCNCDTIDITMRKIGKFEYDITVDDDGLLKDEKIISAFNEKREPMLVGNLLLTNHDDEGNLASLREEQIADLKEHLGIYIGFGKGIIPCIVDCEYC